MNNQVVFLRVQSIKECIRPIFQASVIFVLNLLLVVLPFLANAEPQELTKKAISMSAQSTETKIFLESIEAYQNKDYDKAKWKLHILLKAYPDSPLCGLTHYWLSQSYYRTGNMQEASRYLKIISKEYSEINLKSLLNEEQQELLVQSFASQPTEKAETNQNILDKSLSAFFNSVGTIKPENADATPLQKLDEMLNENPDAPFHDLVLLRISQLYYSVGDLSETAKYLQKLSLRSPDFPLRGLLDQGQYSSIGNSFSVTEPVATVMPEADHALAGKQNTNSVTEKSSPVLSVNDIIFGNASIEIVMEGSLNGYKTFQLNQPERLVIDIQGAKNKMADKSIVVNRYGIEKARIGTYPQSVRVVLDASGSKLPVYEIMLAEKGIKIDFKVDDLIAESTIKDSK